MRLGIRKRVAAWESVKKTKNASSTLLSLYLKTRKCSHGGTAFLFLPFSSCLTLLWAVYKTPPEILFW